ncbi:T9SS type A sorting domain-containing protein [candidate division GN15 bacterium]|nr:T9SS type A sorting domain-containing protein [candidate division GN15 bacterium]
MLKNVRSMKRTVAAVVAGTVVLLLLMNLDGLSQTRDYWSFVNDYSETSNPSGEWSWGRKWSPTGSSFDLMTVRWTDGWYLGNAGHGGPSIGDWGPAMWAKDNSNGIPAVRWTCPQDGFYDLSALFIGNDSRGVDNGVYVILNSSSIFTGLVQAHRDTVSFDTTQVWLAGGDRIDFVLRWHGGVYSEYGWTNLRVVIQNSTAPPSIQCPGEHYPISTCEFGEIRVHLPVLAADNVSIEGSPLSSWESDTLVFNSDTAGLYSFMLTASNAFGSDTCQFSIALTDKSEVLLDNNNFTFNTTDSSTVMPQPKIVHVSSPCEPGNLDWEAIVMRGVDWLTLDHSFGSNPDSIEISVVEPDTGFTPGIYSGKIKLIDQRAAEPEYIYVSLFVESGVALTEVVAQPGDQVEIPINLHTNQALAGFYIPLKFSTQQPTEVTLDSVVIDESLGVEYVPVSDSQFLVRRPVQPTPMPDSLGLLPGTYVVGVAHFTIGAGADPEFVPIDTTTFIVGTDSYSYEFVYTTGDTVVPVFQRGGILIGDACGVGLAGNVNASSGDATDLPDVIYLVNYLFLGGPAPECYAEANVNGDALCAVDLPDVIHLVNFLFLGGPPPAGCMSECEAGSLLMSLPTYRLSSEIEIDCSYDGEATILTLSSPVDIRGLAVDLTGHGQSDLKSLCSPHLEIYFSHGGGTATLGILDIDGPQVIKAGRQQLVRLPGRYEVSSAIVTDRNMVTVRAGITNGAVDELLPSDYGLGQNYPNPFNPATTIEFALPVPGEVQLEVFNVLGQTVSTLHRGRLEAGYHSIVWDGTNETGETVASGVYFYRLTADDYTKSRKMLLLK